MTSKKHAANHLRILSFLRTLKELWLHFHLFTCPGPRRSNGYLCVVRPEPSGEVNKGVSKRQWPGRARKRSRRSAHPQGARGQQPLKRSQPVSPNLPGNTVHSLALHYDRGAAAARRRTAETGGQGVPGPAARHQDDTPLPPPRRATPGSCPRADPAPSAGARRWRPPLPAGWWGGGGGRCRCLWREGGRVGAAAAAPGAGAAAPPLSAAAAAAGEMRRGEAERGEVRRRSPRWSCVAPQRSAVPGAASLPAGDAERRPGAGSLPPSGRVPGACPPAVTGGYACRDAGGLRGSREGKGCFVPAAVWQNSSFIYRRRGEKSLLCSLFALKSAPPEKRA